jgi:hypothetical protein
MQWLLPLLAILALAFGASVIDRNPNPLRPLDQPRSAAAVPEQQVNKQPKKERADGRDGSKTDQHQTEQSPPPVKLSKTPQDNEKATDRANSSRDDIPQWESIAWTVEAKLTTSDWVAIGATIVAVLQFGALVATIVVMMRTSRRQLRAYLFVETGDIINVATPFEPTPEGQEPPRGAKRWPKMGPAAIMRVRNTGQTPAYDVLNWAAIELREYPLASPPPVRPPPNKNTTSFTVGANVIITKNVFITDPLTEEEVAALRANTKAIWVFGEIVYKDAFGRKRFTKYRYRHNGMTGNIGVSAELTGADEGNQSN